MSETEWHKGTLTKVEVKGGESLEDVAMRLMVYHNIDMKTYFDSHVECLIDTTDYNKYMVISGVLYSVDDKKLDADSDIGEAEINADGSIDYNVRFYNGGCALSEAIEEVVENLKDDGDE